MIVTPLKSDKRRFLLLKSVESPDYSQALKNGDLAALKTWDRFGQPV